MGKPVVSSDGNNYLAQLIDKATADALTGVNVAFIAKVVKVSPPTVNVQPLALSTDGNLKQGIIENALVAFPTIAGKISLKVGNHVICVVLDHDTTHYNRQSFFRQMTKTPHLVNNCVVIGKVAGKEDF